MPGPVFVACSICQRQIMPHSLAIHEAKCLEKWCLGNNTATLGDSPNAAGVQPQSRTTGPSNAKQKLKVSPNKKRHTTAVIRPALAVHAQFQVVGNKATTATITRANVSKSMAPESTILEVRKSEIDHRLPPSPIIVRPYRTGSIDEKRPGTVTLSPSGRAASLDRSATNTNNENLSATVVCYVCGQRCGRNTIDVHEKKCLHIWQCLVAKLPPAIRVYQPQKLQYPSVDGTIDPTRLDLLAQQSAHRSQKVDCSRCRKTAIDLLIAREHVRQCGTKNPDRALPKTDNAGGNSVKPKRKKAKEREIFVNIF